MLLGSEEIKVFECYAISFGLFDIKYPKPIPNSKQEHGYFEQEAGVLLGFQWTQNTCVLNEGSNRVHSIGLEMGRGEGIYQGSYLKE